MGAVEREQHPRVCLGRGPSDGSSAAGQPAPGPGHPGRSGDRHHSPGKRAAALQRRADRPGRAGGAVMQRPSGISLSDLFAICREDPANRWLWIRLYLRDLLARVVILAFMAIGAAGLAYGLGGAFAYGFMQTVASYQVQLSVEKSP
ncbi:hypothetical protein [Pseudomonas phage ZCPA1]|nr:hypothetical protein [Pseudomonas phage ZCPA1]